MVTLLAPYALAASAVLAVPVIIHLLKPKRVRTMPFSSLRWLRSSKHKLSRRIQWHQVLLFFLRAFLLCALVLALAKPVYSPGVARSIRERFVVVDVSRSMGYAKPGEETPLEKAKKLACSLLEQGLPGDRTTVLLAGHKSVALGPLSADPGSYRARIETARLQSGDSDFGSALALIAPQLEAPRTGAQAELFFITDNHRGAWSQSAITEFTQGCAVPLSVHVLDVGPSAPGNAWIAEARPVRMEGRNFLRVRVGASGAESLERTVRVRGPAALGAASQSVNLFPGTVSEVDLPVSADVEASGNLAEVAIEPPDGLPEDDVFRVRLDARGPRVLMIEPLISQMESLQPGYHLRAAFEALSRSGSAPVLVTRRAPEAVVASDFENADIVVFADVPELSDDRLLNLENRVKGGAGFLLFSGASAKASFYNTRLYNSKAGELSLLPAPVGGLAADGLSALARIAWTHPLLAALSDPVFGDLARMRARAHHRFEGLALDGATTVLAFFEDGAPALMERQVGAGRVLVFNTTANDVWSDLPRRGSFLPLVDRVLARLSHAQLGRSFRAGEPVVLPVSGAGENARATVTSPAGISLSVSLASAGNQTVVRVDGADEPGVYDLRAQGDGGSVRTQFAVNAGLGEAVVKKMDGEILRSWWSGAAFEMSHPDPAAAEGSSLPGTRLFLWPGLLVFAALMFLAEMFFVHCLTPAMNPATVASTVARQGIVAPATRREVVR